MGKTPEGVILEAVTKFCATIPGLRLSRNHSGQTRSFQRYGCFSPGGPDLLGWFERKVYTCAMADFRGHPLLEGVPIVIPYAQFVGIEVKAPGERATAEQEAFLSDARISGCLVGVVHSVEETAALLGVEVPK